MTTFAIHANGTFWGAFDGETPEAAMQAAADELGTDGNTDGLTAVEIGAHVIALKSACASNDVDMADLVREKFNCHEAEIDAQGAIWIANPQSGHWLDAARTAEVIAFVEAA